MRFFLIFKSFAYYNSPPRIAKLYCKCITIFYYSHSKKKKKVQIHSRFILTYRKTSTKYSSTIKKITYYKKNILKINKTIIHSCTEKKRIDPPPKSSCKKTDNQTSKKCIFLLYKNVHCRLFNITNYKIVIFQKLISIDIKQLHLTNNK